MTGPTASGPSDAAYFNEAARHWRPEGRADVGPLIVRATAPEGVPLTFTVPEVAADGYTHRTPDLTHPSNQRPADPVAAAITWR